MKKQQTFKVKAAFAFSLPPEPMKQVLDKNGVGCIMTPSRFFEECRKPNNRFTRTTAEGIAPALCLGAGFLLLAAIIGQSFR